MMTLQWKNANCWFGWKKWKKNIQWKKILSFEILCGVLPFSGKKHLLLHTTANPTYYYLVKSVRYSVTVGFFRTCENCLRPLIATLSA